MRATLIKNGTIVTAIDTYKADILIEGERIVAIGENLHTGTVQVFDAHGRYIIPGGIDVHTHLDMPWEDISTADDFESGTIAAAFGGTTCIVDFAISSPGSDLAQTLDQWHCKAEGKAAIDYGFHMTIRELTARSLSQMEGLIEQGVTSFKVFTDYPGRLMVDDGTILRLLLWAREHGGLIQVHAINGVATEVLVEAAAAEGHLEPIYHGLCRPSLLEGEATARILILAEVAQAPVYIVHLSCQEALLAICQAKQRGVLAFAETCPQYLYLSQEQMVQPGFEGAKFVCNPPLRGKKHTEALWRGLANGNIDTVATDHCCFNLAGQKDRGQGDFRKIPNGLPGIETRLPLIYQGVAHGQITLNQFVQLTSTHPAQLFGLYPQKGSLTVGADADLVIWNPEKTVSLSVNDLHMQVDYSIFEELQISGAPEQVWLRGKRIVDNGAFLGRPGAGHYVKRGSFDRLSLASI